jgi:hypothetical protein
MRIQEVSAPKIEDLEFMNDQVSQTESGGGEGLINSFKPPIAQEVEGLLGVKQCQG